MLTRLVLACALLAACSKTADAGTPLPGGGYSYLVTPAGHMYRLLKVGPVIGAGGKKLGTVVSYAGDTRKITTIETDAEALVSALGPEVELSGETVVIVQTMVGHDPTKMISRSVSYNVVFERREGRWVRSPRKPGEPEELDGIQESPKPHEDPAFPFDPSRTKGAAEVAAKWVALIDAGRVDASVAAMSETFRSRVGMDQWRGLVTQRAALGVRGGRVELYRMQSRNGNLPMPPGGAAVIQYEVRPPQGARYLERVELLDEQGVWRPAGYAFQAIAGR